MLLSIWIFNVLNKCAVFQLAVNLLQIMLWSGTAKLVFIKKEKKIHCNDLKYWIPLENVVSRIHSIH